MLFCDSSSERGAVYSLLLAELTDGDSIHVHDALLGEALAHGHDGTLLRLELHLADEAEALELLDAVADALAGSHSVDLSLGATAGLGAEVLTETLDTDVAPSHVELVADSGGADVEPVIVEGGKFLVEGSLNVLTPLLNIILIRTDDD